VNDKTWDNSLKMEHVHGESHWVTHPAVIGVGAALLGINWLIPLTIIFAFMCCKPRRYMKHYEWTCCGYLTVCQTFLIVISPLAVLIWIIFEECCVERDDEDEEPTSKGKTVGQIAPFEDEAFKANMPNVDKAGKIRTAQSGPSKKDTGYGIGAEDEKGLPNYKYVPGGQQSPQYNTEFGMQSEFGMESNIMQSGIMSEMGISHSGVGLKKQATQDSLDDSPVNPRRQKKDTRKKRFEDRAQTDLQKADEEVAEQEYPVCPVEDPENVDKKDEGSDEFDFE